MKTFTIKPLEWRGIGPGPLFLNLYAETLLGKASIIFANGNWLLTFAVFAICAERHPTSESAKAAAQDNFDARISAALVEVKP